MKISSYNTVVERFRSLHHVPDAEPVTKSIRTIKHHRSLRLAVGCAAMIGAVGATAGLGIQTARVANANGGKISVSKTLNSLASTILTMVKSI